jgi:F-type H+-transporting ATPase subunit alpha
MTPTQNNFTSFLNATNEIGYVDQVVKSIIYAHGLPTAHPGETVLFETGQMGFVVGLHPESLEILLLSPVGVNVGTRLTRTGSSIKMKVSDDMLGKVFHSHDLEEHLLSLDQQDTALRTVDLTRMAFAERQRVSEPLETGVTMVDLVVPLGKGQRELVIGDRKTGKSRFLFQTLRSSAKKNYICIYASIAKSQLEIQRLSEQLQQEKLMPQSILIASHSIDRPGIVYLTPFIAMTIAEYFRDQGRDVLVILDDLTTHARYYREVMLLAKRFPGRSSYPGDIFYLHARLLERAGKFKKGSITCLPVAQSVLSDVSGFIQSNLMSMTDGHILFDSDLFDQGRRPAINPFLSVTRVGEQTHTQLLKEVSRQLRSYLVSFEKVKQFRHFQTELSENTRQVFEIGNRLIVFLDQMPDLIIPISMNLVLYAGIMSGLWKSTTPEVMKKEMNALIAAQAQDEKYRQLIEETIKTSQNLTELQQKINTDESILITPLNTYRQQQQETAQKGANNAT